MKPFPIGSHTPPIIGEYAYYHAPLGGLWSTPHHYICVTDEHEKNAVGVHYTLSENTGNKPFITCQGKLKEIISKIEH